VERDVASWEEISILEVTFKREQSILARCRSSDIVKESLKQIINLSTDAEVSKSMNILIIPL